MDLAKTTAPDLFRDVNTNAIICTDPNRYAQYRATRAQQKVIASLEAQLAELQRKFMGGTDK